MTNRPAVPLILAACLSIFPLHAAAQAGRGAAQPQTAPGRGNPQPAPTQAPALPPTLPGGASQLQETHGDWRLACVQQAEQRLCTLIQQQNDRDSGQLVLGLEFTALPGDAAEGTIVLPFGVAVDKPVTLLVDDVVVGTEPFRTCLPVGCIVVVPLDARRVAQFTQAKMLGVRTASVPDGQEVSFRVSMNGFASGLARMRTLAR